jgi:CRISPR-associated protein Cmr6
MVNNRPIRRQPDRGGNENPQQPPREQPSIWLNSRNLEPDPKASFVEYLRWMREPDSDAEETTKVQLLQEAQDRADYSKRLQILNKRTKELAGQNNHFRVTCSFRVRVGGHRGPESILLPAFDALGIPYIPSSTLRGIARSQAIQEIMTQDNITWEQAESRIALYFGDINASNPKNITGKVIFFDAYPEPKDDDKSGGLSVDIANNIWKWKEDNFLGYGPNPNSFFSLKNCTFVVGLRPMTGCDESIFKQVIQWLIAGLCKNGAGSQINSGYGHFYRVTKNNQPITIDREFLQVKFTLAGQLIHGNQRFNSNSWKLNNNQWQNRGKAEAEVRPTAFKSMLRYWFRAFALGILSTEQITQLKEWEASIFGGINPRKLGWISCHIIEGEILQPEPLANEQGRHEDCGEQAGTLVLSYARETPQEKREAVAKLLKSLTWLMFHLGGVGQGARRPCYSRENREGAPWWRGSTLTPDPDGIEKFWNLPNTLEAFQRLFRQHIAEFYQAFNELFPTSVNPYNPRLQSVKYAAEDNWADAVDANCKIVVCKGRGHYEKVYALKILHSQELKHNGDYDKQLCGRIKPAKCSPVWIKDIDYSDSIAYQVVTVFGVNSGNNNPRNRYLQKLQQGTENSSYLQIFPFVDT